jgi:HK97 family phage major capsid protein
MPALAKRDERPKVGQRIQRLYAFERAAVNEEERTIELSFSSDAPVDRYWGIEVLSHKKDACDLAFLNDGAPLLLEHDRYEQIGVVEEATIKDGKGRAKVRFSKAARASEIFQDVLDKIRTKVSVSYEIHDLELTEKKDDQETFTITRWSPIEISIVSIPADNTVGTDRSAPQNSIEPPITQMRKPLFDPAPGGTAGGGGTPGAGAVVTMPVPPAPTHRVEITSDQLENERKLERKRTSQIIKLAGSHGVDHATTQRFIDENKPVEEFQAHILEHRYKAQEIDLPSPELGMDKKDVKRYRLVRALHARATGERIDGVEKEASDEVAKRCKRDPKGFFIPHDVTGRSLQDVHGLTPAQMMSLAANMQRMHDAFGSRSLTSSVGSAGGFTVGTNVLGSSMIELLRNATLVLQLGANHLTGLQGNIAIPKQSGGATAYWVGEDNATTTSDQTFGQLGLTPKRVGAFTRYSRQLLTQSSIDVEAFIRMDLMLVLAIAKDLACLAGTGGAQPLGILNTTGINSITFGAAATWAKVVQFETEVASDNARFGALAYLVTAATRGKWKTIEAFANTGVTLWDRGANTVNGYRAEVTEQLPTNRVIFGNWRDLAVGDWDGLDVTVDPYTNAENDLTRVIVNTMTDNGVRHAESFCASSDSGAQ